MWFLSWSTTLWSVRLQTMLSPGKFAESHRGGLSKPSSGSSALNPLVFTSNSACGSHGFCLGFRHHWPLFHPGNGSTRSEDMALFMSSFARAFKSIANGIAPWSQQSCCFGMFMCRLDSRVMNQMFWIDLLIWDHMINHMINHDLMFLSDILDILASESDDLRIT